MTETSGIADAYPMSPTQAGMVFETLADPRAGVYVVQAVVTLKGRVEPATLASTVQQLVDRHAILRTVLAWHRIGKPLQVVRDGVEADVRTVDHSQCQDADAALASLLAADRIEPLDFDKRPGFRTTLCRRTDEHHDLVFTFHHALLDGWSIEILVDELVELYDAVETGRTPRLTERRPFRDFVAWLAARPTEASHAFWSAELEGLAEPTSITATAGAAAERGPSHHTVRRRLPTALADELREFARTTGVTLNTLIQGAWSILLAHHARDRDVVFGITTAGRPPSLDGAEDMVGMFLTTVPSRVRVTGSALLADWLKALQSANFARVEHEHTPLVDIQQRAHRTAHTALFESVLVFENVPRHRAAASLQVDRVDYHDVSNYPLALIVDPVDDITLKLVTDNAVYDPSTIGRLLERFETLLASLGAPDCRTVDDASVMSGADRRDLALFNDTAVASEDDRTVDQMIAEHVERAPTAVALAAAGETLTYAELGARSEAIADELRHRGAGRGDLVGVLLPRSVDACVALLGVLKAGAGYVPLDPSYPAERLRFMIQDAGVGFVLMSPTDDASALLRLDDVDACAVAAEQVVIVTIGARTPTPTPTPTAARDDDPAYMIYTSGSTGQPNGVPITHAQLRHSTLSRGHAYGASPDSFLLLSSLSFDSSVVGLFWTLTTGGTLVVPDAGAELDPAALGRLIESRAVSHTLCIPAMHGMLLEHVDPAILQPLRVVIVAGEACSIDLVQRHHAVLPHAALYNEYGPTEAAVWCTVHRCDPAAADSVVPIGHPIANTEIFLVDDRGEPVPTGVPGELIVGGLGVACGYHDRAELTAQRFVERTDLRRNYASSFDRFFRTGDLAVLRADGVLEFAGRIDAQTKIRGHRIEPEGIEQIITQVSGVTRCAVDVREGDGGLQLVACVEAVADNGHVREHVVESLRERLPRHAIPAAVVVVDRLPTLPNGKVDRRALADLDAIGAAPDDPVAPRDDLESTLHSIWTDLLPTTEFGVHDDFFSVGGHSILAVSLIERIRKATGRTLRLTELLDATTIAEQAALVSGGRMSADEASSVVALTPLGTGPKLILVPPVAGTPLTFRALVAALPADHQVLAFSPAGTDDDGAPDSTVEQMAARYVRDMVREQPAGPYRVGGSCFGGHVAWEMACQLLDRGAEVESVIVIDGLAPDHGPGWTTTRPQRTLAHLLKQAIRHAFNRSLLRRIRTRLQIGRQGPRFATVRATHVAAKCAYEAREADVDVLLIQSSELGKRPEIVERWNALCGGRVTQRVVSGHHVELMESPAVVARVLDEYLAPREPSAVRATDVVARAGSPGSG